MYLYILFYFSAYSFVTDHSPMIYLSVNETFNPSSIEYFEKYTHLVNETVRTNERLETPSSILPFFKGEKNAPVYALLLPDLNEKDPVNAILDPKNHNTVVTYFNFYPYNRGKRFLDTIWDNHVGDIEHCHVFFEKGKPTKITASYHAWNTTKEWKTVNKTNNHPILYSAKGSHGLWFTEGEHLYHENPPFSDHTSKGVKWKTWENLVLLTPFNWNNFQAYNKPWLTEIYRWGNPSTDFPENNCYFGYCRLEDGPVGMLGKSLIKETIEKLKKEGYICKDCIWDSGIF